MNKQQYLAQATPVLTEKSIKIIEAVKAAGFMLKDEHDPKGERILPLAGVAVFQHGDKQDVVALFTGSFSSYYSLNAIALRSDGPAVTRNNCAGVVRHATDNPAADLDAIVDGINWKAVENYPGLCPGQYFNVVLKTV